MSVYVIAEAGVNHNGSLDIAMALVDKAKECGADAVKFQTFVAGEIITKNAEKAEYQKKTTSADENQYDMVKKLELGYNEHLKLAERCREIGIDFMSTPFDLPSIDLLENLQVPTYKIPSGEIINLPYLRKLANLRKKYIMSTGMCEMGEIANALEVFYLAGCSKDDITLLHANTQYPTPYKDVNLNAMVTIGKTFGHRYGYSDHTKGIEVPIAAVALGASVIEKHFTLDCAMDGPDHKASLEPKEMAQMVASIRNIEEALGDGIKRVSDSERGNLMVARKSLVAKRSVKKGEIFTEDNLTSKRPGTGKSPMLWDDFIGKPAMRDYEEDEQI